MRNISWCPCLNTWLNLHISINCDKRAVVHSTNVVFKMTVITTDPVTNTDNNCSLFSVGKLNL